MSIHTLKKRLEELKKTEEKEIHKLEILRKKLEILEILEKKETKKLLALKNRQRPNKIQNLTKTLALISMLALFKSDEPKITPTTTQDHTIHDNEYTDDTSTEDISIEEKEKTYYIPPQEKKTDTKKETKITKTPKHTKETPKHITNEEDEVFSLIENVDWDIDPERYSNRNNLQEKEKKEVKKTYYQLIRCKQDQEIKNIMNQIKNIKITRGLRDVIAKKTHTLQQQKKNTDPFQRIGKINVERESTLLNEQSTANSEKNI